MIMSLLGFRCRLQFLTIIILVCSYSGLLAKDRVSSETSRVAFDEVWAYLFAAEETFFPKQSPITDVAYFCARLNEEGRLSSIPDIARLPVSCKNLRKHLVVACAHNRAQMYWLLRRDQLARESFIEDIVKASEKFDGIQIDFESLRAQEGDAFVDFLKVLRARLDASKCLSVALLPRWKDQKEEAFPYVKIAAIVDRVIVMAYDEHWRTSKPGPIASLPWCEKICDYAQKNIPANKLVMGLPLYGRVWALNEVSASLRYSSTLKLWEKHKTPVRRLKDDVPHFAFEEKIQAECYFEDMRSLKAKLGFYESKQIKAVAFWRVSQEPAKLWQYIALSKKPVAQNKKY